MTNEHTPEASGPTFQNILERYLVYCERVNVHGEEARAMGLANRLTEPGRALAEALTLAHQLAALPQNCLRSDRASAYEQWDLALDQALGNEARRVRAGPPAAADSAC